MYHRKIKLYVLEEGEEGAKDLGVHTYIDVCFVAGDTITKR